MRQFYNVEIPYYTNSDIEKAQAFYAYLKENGWWCEVSGADTYIHLEILLYPHEAVRVNKALDDIVYNDAITEVTI